MDTAKPCREPGGASGRCAGFAAMHVLANPDIVKHFGKLQRCDPKNPAYQHDRSPAFFTDKITRALLVVQGEKDARVKQDQSEKIVSPLPARKVPVHYLLLQGEGHGFTKNENNLKAYQMTDRFLDRYLWGDVSVQVD